MRAVRAAEAPAPYQPVRHGHRAQGDVGGGEPVRLCQGLPERPHEVHRQPKVVRALAALGPRNYFAGAGSAHLVESILLWVAAAALGWYGERPFVARFSNDIKQLFKEWWIDEVQIDALEQGGRHGVTLFSSSPLPSAAASFALLVSPAHFRSPCPICFRWCPLCHCGE